MNSFVVLYCILISGVGFVSTGNTDHRIWNDAVPKSHSYRSPRVAQMESADPVVVEDATAFFNWYINSQKQKTLGAALGNVPQIPNEYFHAMFTMHISIPQKENIIFEVFNSLKKKRPTSTRIEGRQYSHVIEVDTKKHALKLLKTALGVFIKDNFDELGLSKLKQVTIDYDVLTIPAGDTNKIAGTNLYVQVVGTTEK